MNKVILANAYDVGAFEIATIKLERIFVDKIFAAEFYYLSESYFDVAKHLYDLVVLLQNEKIMSIQKDELVGIVTKFAESGWDVLDVPSKNVETVVMNLTHFIKGHWPCCKQYRHKL